MLRCVVKQVAAAKERKSHQLLLVGDNLLITVLQLVTIDRPYGIFLVFCSLLLS